MLLLAKIKSNSLLFNYKDIISRLHCNSTIAGGRGVSIASLEESMNLFKRTTKDIFNLFKFYLKT